MNFFLFYLWLLMVEQIVSKMIPYVVGFIASIFTSSFKKWRYLAAEVQLSATGFFWMLGTYVSRPLQDRAFGC